METLFFITPIGAEGSPERRRADFIFQRVLEPLCAELGIQALRADLINEPTSLINKIIRLILEADHVVCDLASGKPNVYYELGIRHCTGLPAIHLMHPGEAIPFDVKDVVMVFVDEERPEELPSVAGRIRDMLIHARESRESLNPVTIAARMADIGFTLKRLAPETPAAPKGDGGDSGIEDWSGTWVTNFGRVRVWQDGTRLSGAYHYHSDHFIGTFTGEVRGDWLLFSFPVRTSAYPGFAYIDRRRPGAYGCWLHNPAVTSFEQLEEQLGRNLQLLDGMGKRWKAYGHFDWQGSYHELARLPGAHSPMVQFWLGTGRDYAGRTLAEILCYEDARLDSLPDWLPWVFPEYGPEGNYPGLTYDDLQAMRTTPIIRENMLKAFAMALRYYGFKLKEGGSGLKVVKAENYAARVKDWVIVKHFHHNRITRILRSLNMFAMPDHARAFLSILLEIQKQEFPKHMLRAVKYWRLACGLDRG